MKPNCYVTSILAFALIVLSPSNSESRKSHPEKDYQEKWCRENGGIREIVQKDRTRVDCLTAQYAVEVDFGPKWAEAVGQALHYAEQTGKRAGIVLILEKKNDWKYWVRLKRLIRHHRLDIQLWSISPKDL
ncbi:MAG: hypothetical protein COV67_10640 [Nitrospinae bacterium CG11_big_fil_rev_8_21_14_0_20_56_8]|nr:MAG: hypothetical protein COV67_10640 [Nitrospinae bacterium CG11_big_fil_rev_8_21_14_0_20_56_8]